MLTNISIKFSSFLSHIQAVQGSKFLNHDNFKFSLKHCFDCDACINRKICCMGVVQGGIER